MNNLNMKVFYKNVYGNDLCYPFCNTAKKFAKLINQKTFSSYHLHNISHLGYAIDVVAYNPKQKDAWDTSAEWIEEDMKENPQRYQDKEEA
jgi:hypothetical protein|tara:strand:+ start:832 stop:1104 length:273 start_codon:yes stop_codon:yes gene_type:complete